MHQQSVLIPVLSALCCPTVSLLLFAAHFSYPAALGKAQQSDSKWSIAGGSNADLGLKLNDGSVIRHSFVLRNMSDKPLLLGQARASVPCCSSIGPVPTLIPPHCEAAVPVAFEPRTRRGKQCAHFTIPITSQETAESAWVLQ